MKAREPRKPLMIPAQIRRDGAAVNVTIRNVSSNGMMLSGAVLPPPGSEVEIIRGGLELTCRVVWSAADLCGVRTDASVDDVLLERGCFTAPKTGRPQPADLRASPLLSSSPLLREQRAFALLNELQRVHAGLIDAISALDVLFCRDLADRPAFAELRLRLMQASGEKLKLIETAIYPHLEQCVSSFDKALLEQLRNESFSLRATSTRHVAAWSLDRIIGDWAGYSRAAADMLTAMRRRVEREKTLLYPLLQSHCAGPKAGAPFSYETYREAC